MQEQASALEQAAAKVSWESYKSADSRDGRVGVYAYDRTLSTDDAAVYVNHHKNGDILIGYRGTSPRLDDLALDAKIALGKAKSSRQVKESAATLAAVKQAYANRKVVLTGHSKGGWIAQELAGVEHTAHVFNAAVTPEQVYRSWFEPPRKHVTYHRVEGDAVSILSPFLRGEKKTRKMKPAINVGGSAASKKKKSFKTTVSKAIAAHALGNFIL